MVAPGPLVEGAAHGLLQGRYVLRVLPSGGAPSQIEPDLGRAEVLIFGEEIFSTHPDPEAGLSDALHLMFLLTKAVVRGMMRRRYGRIIAVTPLMNGGTPHVGSVVGATAGLVKSVARETGSRGVTANVLALGHSADGGRAPSPYIAAARGVTPDDVSAALTYLLAPEAGYITGQVIALDGGLGAA